MPECQLVKAASRTFADYTDRLDVSGEAPRILVHFDAGTELVYEAKDRCEVVVAVYPGNWRERRAAET